MRDAFCKFDEYTTKQRSIWIFTMIKVLNKTDYFHIPGLSNL